MRIQHFLTYIMYDGKTPEHISPARWRGMLKWYYTRLNEGHTIPQMNHMGNMRHGCCIWG